MNYNQPRRLLFLDTETLPSDQNRGRGAERQKLRLGVLSKWLHKPTEKNPHKGSHSPGKSFLYRRSKTDVFHSTGTFLELLEASTSSRYPTWIFAHKLSFDLQVSGLFNALKSERWSLDSRRSATPDDPDGEYWSETMRSFFVIGDPPTAMALRSPKGHKVYCVDTLNFWPVALSKLGDQVGKPKKTMPRFNDADSVWVDYCRRDVEIIETAVINLITWLDSNKIGRMRFTSSGLAAEAFRVGCPGKKVYAHQEQDTRKLERKGYFGGEVRAFQVGEISGDLYQVDVNSLYPFIMRDNDLPFELMAISGNAKWQKGIPPENPLTLMAEVWIRDYGDSYPKRMNDSTNYCRGSFATILCGAELDAAINRGDVIGFRRWSKYSIGNLFSEFVSKYWQMRVNAKVNGDPITDLFCKSILNSLYGRFGMMSQHLVHRTDFTAPIAFGRWATVSSSTKKIRRFQVMNHKPFEIVGKKEIKKSFPALSAFITAAGREYMRGLRRLVGRRCLVYQGVDSLVINRAGLDKLESADMIDPLTLGKLKIEARANNVNIVGHGNYRFGEKLVTMGRKSSAVAIGANQYRQTMIETAPEIIFSPPGQTVKHSERIIQMPKPTVEGDIQPDGTVWPKRFTEPLPRELY